MEPMETATTVERQLLERARHTHTPINGSLELLPICNMNCDMCYVRLSREEVQALGGLHTADEWIAVGQQMKEAGVLFLLLKGCIWNCAAWDLSLRSIPTAHWLMKNGRIFSDGTSRAE